MNKLYCVIRRTWVADLPEERLRQTVLKFMLEEGGYPPGLISLEASLHSSLRRRTDIVCYWKNEGLSPLLVVECKAKKLTLKALQQACGYNHFLKAPFIALTSAEKSIWGWFDHSQKKYNYYTGFPDYNHLINVSDLLSERSELPGVRRSAPPF